MKLLVTGAGALLGQGIIRAIQQSTLDATIVAADPSPLSAGLYWTPHRYLIPMAHDPRYVEELGRVVAAEKPDAILIGTDTELSVLSGLRTELETAWKTHVIVSSPDVVAIADDKYLTYEFMRSKGFRAPDSCLPGAESALLERVGFPLIVKPRIGARAIGMYRVENHAELSHALAQNAAPVIQECVGDAGHEYTASALVFDGKAGASIVMRRELRDGNTFRAFVGTYEDLNRDVRRMGEALGAHGPVNFQFRIDRDGFPVVFEINARFSGTTPLRHLAGFPEVEMVLRHVVLGEPVQQPDVQNVTILRHWQETVLFADTAPPARLAPN